MPALAPGKKAPSFKLPADDGSVISLSDFKGRKVILYFYPKDDTPGCTTEACDFNDNLKALSRLKIQVIGASKDSPASHAKFRKKYGLSFPLVSDEKGTLCEDYGVWVEKSMYGKKYMGIERSTFLIDENGKIAQIWSKVKPAGHVREILAALNGE